jgi:hypothetical protein
MAVLADAASQLSIRRTPLDVIGVRFWTRDARRIGTLAGSSPAFKILLAHDPRRVTEASEVGIPLVVSGHTHGGQVVLPVFGAVAALSRWSRARHERGDGLRQPRCWNGMCPSGQLPARGRRSARHQPLVTG